MLKRWKAIAEDVAEAARRILGEAEVIVFGSIVEGEYTASSDIDILIVLEDMPMGRIKRAELKRAIEEEAAFPPFHPVEIHLVTRKEAQANPIYAEALRQGVTINP